MSDVMALLPELRAGVATVREPVCDEDGYVTHHEMRELAVMVHTVQTGKGGWVCETEDGTVMVVPYEMLRFTDGEDDR